MLENLLNVTRLLNSMRIFSESNRHRPSKFNVKRRREGEKICPWALKRRLRRSSQALGVAMGNEQAGQKVRECPQKIHGDAALGVGAWNLRGSWLCCPCSETSCAPFLRSCSKYSSQSVCHWPLDQSHVSSIDGTWPAAPPGRGTPARHPPSNAGSASCSLLHCARTQPS